VWALFNYCTTTSGDRMERRTVLKAMLAANAVAVPWSASRAADGPLKVGFIYPNPVGDSGFAYQQDLGRKALEEAMGDKISVRTIADIAEGPDVERVARELSLDGNKLIFAVSFGYMNPV